MLLKRIYDTSDKKRPKFSHILVIHTGHSAEQNFKRQRVEEGVTDGWISLSQGKLILHAKPEDLVYSIKNSPGHYCLHCKSQIMSGADGAMSRLHVSTSHKDIASPDPQWPLGYRVTHAYECVLDAAQHEKFKALPIGLKGGK